MVSKEDIVAEARSWIGTPYVHQGRTKGVGVDCIGVAIGVSRDLQLAAYHKEEIAYTAPDGIKMVNGLSRWCYEVERPYPDNLQDGDVALMTWRKWPIHCGIIAHSNGYMTLIHSYRDFRKCTEHRLDDKWCGRITHGFRYKGFVDGVLVDG